MADVQLDDLSDRRDRQHIVVVQPVSGMHLDTQARGVACRLPQSLELARPVLTLALRIQSGVQLDDRHTRLARGLDLRDIRIDEQRHADARVPELPASQAQRLPAPDHVEPPFGGQLGTALGHQAAVGGPHADRELDHRAGCRHLQIHARGEHCGQCLHVALLDVPAILAQVQRDVVRAGLLGQQCGLQRLGIARVALLAQCRDVVDVDPQCDGRVHQIRPSRRG